MKLVCPIIVFLRRKSIWVIAATKAIVSDGSFDLVDAKGIKKLRRN